MVVQNWDKHVNPISCCRVLPGTAWFLVDPPPQTPAALVADGQQIDGTYDKGADYNGTPTYVRAGGAWTLWWSVAPHGWFITPVVGTLVAAPGSMWFKLADPDPCGTYDHQSPTDTEVVIGEVP
jgi:hypothetical protein